MNVLQESAKTDLVKKLSDLIEETETIYTAIAEEYPKIQQEVENGFSRSDNQISLIAAEGGNGLDALHTIMENTRECIQGAHKSFSDLSDNDARMLDILKKSISRLDTLEELINNITFNTEEMELISLNAMVVALKAGHEGGGFSHVTDELRRISAKTISEAKNLTNEGKQIQNYFEEVQNTADSIAQEQEHIFSQFGIKLFEKFNTIETRLTAIVEFFTTLRSRANEIREPLFKMTEAVQSQDLIRQTIDQIKLTLGQIQNIDTSIDDETQNSLLLDEYTFLEQVSNLGAYLLEEITKTITDNSETFKTGITQVHEIVEKIEQERDLFVTRQIEGADSEDGIYDLFQHSEEDLATMLRDTRKVPKLKQAMRTSNNAFIGRIQGLEEGFQKFTTMVGRFRNIHVAARIEVAKRQILKEMQSTVQEMRSLTENIIADVEKALETTKDFIETAQEAETGFRESYRVEINLAESFSLEIQRLYKHLKTTNDEIVATMKSFTLFSIQFREIFNTTEGNAADLFRLGKKSRTIMEIFERTARSAAARKEHLMREQGITSWEIHEDRLQETVSQFTIYAHKARAGEIAGFDIESGIDEGEVTFF